MPDVIPAALAAATAPAFPPDVWRELRASHMGETVAVALYDGVLAATADPQMRRFALSHRAVEAAHLAGFQALVPPPRRSRLLPAWRVCGRLMGWLPARAGRRVLFAVIAAVESWVAGHYGRQIALVARRAPDPALLALLRRCRADERRHGEDAAGLLPPGGPGWPARLLAEVAVAGSRAGVRLAKWM